MRVCTATPGFLPSRAPLVDVLNDVDFPGNSQLLKSNTQTRENIFTILTTDDWRSKLRGMRAV
jgi:hypothetical protein